MMKLIVSLTAFLSMAGMSFTKYQNEIPNVHGKAVVIIRTSYRSTVPREFIISELMKLTLGKDMNMEIADYADPNIIFFSSEEDMIAQYDQRGNFDKYKTAAYAAGFLGDNAEFFSKLTGRNFSHILIFEADSPYSESSNKTSIRLGFTASDAARNIQAVSFTETSFSGALPGEGLASGYAKEIAACFAAEAASTGFFARLKD